MDRDDYAANWRGARLYQFNEEARRKRAFHEAPDQPVVDHWPTTLDYERDQPRDFGPIVLDGIPKVVTLRPFRWVVVLVAIFVAFSATYYFV